MTTVVVTASPDDSFKDAVDRMLARGVSSLPVVTDDGRLVGVVSETDLIANEAFEPRKRGALALMGRALSGHDAAFVRKACERRVHELMTPEVVCAHPDDPLHKTARLMLDFEINHLPVVGDDGHLVGVVARHDLLSVFRRSDADIQAEIDSKLHDPLWAPDDVHVTVAVRDGVVTATGSVRTKSDRRVVEHMLETVTGVVAVDSDITARQPEARLGPYVTPPLR